MDLDKNQDSGNTTPLSYRLHGLPATSPLERVSPSTQDTHSRKVPGCAIVTPSPSAPDSFKAELKGDSMAPYIFGQQTPPIPSRTHNGWRWHYVEYGTKRPVRNMSQPVDSVTCKYQQTQFHKKKPPVGTRSSARPDRPWDPPSLLYNGYRVLPGGRDGRSVRMTLTPFQCRRSWKRVQLNLYAP